MKKIITTLITCMSLGLLSQCNAPNEIQSPNQRLLNSIDNRLSGKDLQTASLENPYDVVGIELEQFHRKLSSEYSTNQQRAFLPILQNSQATAGFFTTVSNRAKWGVTDRSTFQNVVDEVKEFQLGQKIGFDDKRLTSINSHLASYTKDDSGFNEMLNDGVKNGNLSNTAEKVLRMTLTHVSAAKSVEEALMINSTVEHEVLQSEIDPKDRAILLSVNSILRHTIAGANSRSVPDGPGQNQKVAQVVVVVIVAAIVAVAGYVSGGIVGAASCCLFQGNCTWDCISPYARDGALAALAAEYIY
jgi:hypothetical protein